MCDFVNRPFVYKQRNDFISGMTGRHFVVWQMFMLYINCYLSKKLYSSKTKLFFFFLKVQEFRPRTNNAIYMRLLWLTFVIQCTFVFAICFCGCFLHIIGTLFLLYHCIRLNSTFKIRSTSKKNLWFGFWFVIIQLL